jgi:hypothetical protein
MPQLRRFLIHTFSALKDAIVKYVPLHKIKDKETCITLRSCISLNTAIDLLIIYSSYSRLPTEKSRLKSCVIVTTDNTVVLTGIIVLRSTVNKPHLIAALNDGLCAQMEGLLRLWPIRTSAESGDVT